MSKCIIHERIYPKIQKTFSSKKAMFFKIIQDYLDENHEALFANNPGPRLSFTTRYEIRMYDLVGVTPEEIETAVKDSGENKAGWYNRNRPVYPFLVECIRYFDKIKDKKMKDITVIFLTILIYSFNQRQFVRYNTGSGFENCMQYTVNNLSEKYLLKQLGTIYKCLEATGLKADQTYTSLIRSNTDFDNLQYFTNILTRVRQFLKKIMQQFYANKASGKYINAVNETATDEGEKTGLREVDSGSAQVEKIVNLSMLYAKTNKPNIKMVSLAAKVNDVSQNGLYMAIEKIFKNENSRLEEVFRLIVTIFLIDEKQTYENINSSKFILICQRTYSKSHTNEKNVLDLKQKLSDLLQDYCVEYIKSNRAATKINFKKALFYYLIMHIQVSKRGGS